MQSKETHTQKIDKKGLGQGYGESVFNGDSLSLEGWDVLEMDAQQVNVFIALSHTLKNGQFYVIYILP